MDGAPGAALGAAGGGLATVRRMAAGWRPRRGGHERSVYSRKYCAGVLERDPRGLPNGSNGGNATRDHKQRVIPHSTSGASVVSESDLPSWLENGSGRLLLSLSAVH